MRTRSAVVLLCGLVVSLPAGASVPLPVPRPAGLASPPVEPGPVGPGSAAPAQPGAPSSPDEAEETACRARILELGVVAQPLPPLTAGRCTLPRPLQLTRLDRNISVRPAAVLNCRTVEALAQWARQVVLPAAERELGARPVRVELGSAFECRGRNRIPGARLSEHASGNAIDVRAFVFAGKEARVGSTAPNSPERRLEEAARRGACVHFTTVLGPGTDASHADHLHLDVIARKGSRRLCQ